MMISTGAVSVAAGMLALGVAIGMQVGDTTRSVHARSASAADAVMTVRSGNANANSSERYTDLAPILLPESTIRASGSPSLFRTAGAEVVLAAVVDTSGLIEAASVEILNAPDSATARAVRAGVGGIRYIPARMVADVGECLRFNGGSGHCGGATPVVRRLRARVVLRIEAFKAAPVPR